MPAGVKHSSEGEWVNSGRGVTLPTGVTLRDIDGGAGYFDQWSSVGPLSSPDFFPISVFLPYAYYDIVEMPDGSTMSRVESHQDAGINLYVGVGSSDPTDHHNDLLAATAAGMPVIFDPTAENLDPAFHGSYIDQIIGWQWQDELDGQTCEAPELSDPTHKYAFLRQGEACVMGDSSKNDYQLLKTMSNTVRAADPSRPVYMGYTHPYAMNSFPGGPVSRLADASDIIGYDVYVLVDTRSTFGGQVDIGNPWAGFTVVSHARENASFGVPVWPDLESSAVDTNSGMNATLKEPTPAEITALAWNYIIGGARGLCWFNHCFAAAIPGASSNDDLNNPHYWPLREAIKAVNARIQGLARVINRPFADGFAAAPGAAINMMTKCDRTTGEFHVFAASRQAAPQTVTFTLAGGESPVTVVGEDRTITLSNGQFSDSFPDGNAAHIYRVVL